MIQPFGINHRVYQIGPYTTSKVELIDLLKSWIVISLAFTIIRGAHHSLDTFIATMLSSAITVGTAFLLHELAHKIAAQRYGCFAEFRSNDRMLFFGLLMSFFGFIFFAPGAVMIAGPVGKKRNGIISAAGPGTNFALAIIFLMLRFYIQGTFLDTLFNFGYIINTWLGLFNMLPFWLFDGKKILNWNKTAYYSMLAIGIVLLFSNGLIGVLS